MMFQWLADLGITVSTFGDYGYMVYALVCCIVILLISSIVSVIFGIILGIFQR